VQTIFWLENLKGRAHLEDLGVDERILLQWILRKKVGKTCTGFISPRTGISGGIL
jgi:hypothetical protein